MTVSRMVSILKYARRISEDLIATLQPARCGLPSPCQSRVKQLTIRRPVIPDGDRRHGTESGGVVDEIPSLVSDEDVMRVLVLGEDAFHHKRWPKLATPFEGSFERGLRRHSKRKAVP